MENTSEIEEQRRRSRARFAAEFRARNPVKHREHVKKYVLSVRAENGERLEKWREHERDCFRRNYADPAKHEILKARSRESHRTAYADPMKRVIVKARACETSRCNYADPVKREAIKAKARERYRAKKEIAALMSIEL